MQISEKTVGGNPREFPGISRKFFRGFPGIPEIRGNFSGNLGVFPRTRAAEQGTHRQTVVKIQENPGKFPRKPDGRNFRKFRETFSGDSREFRKSAGTFPEIRGFSQNARCGAGYTSVNRGENRGKFGFFPKKVSGKSPENPPGNPPGNPRKNRAFFSCFFRVRAKIQPISGKSPGKIPPENSPISGKFFPGKSPESPKIPEISGKKGSKMPVFGKIDPLLHTGF